MENTSVSTPESSSSDTSGQATENTKAQPSDADEMVEVALGSVKGKLPKSMAEAVKNLERGAQKAFQDGASAKKAMKDFEGYIKQNPRAALEKFGVDPYEFSEMTLSEKLEMMSLSPEQKELREAKDRLGKYEQAEKDAQAERERLEYTKQETQMVENFDKEIGEAFRESGLPRHKYYVQLIAAEILGASKRGEDLPAKEATLRVKNRFESQVREILEQMDPEGIQKFLSDSTRKKLRDYEVKRVTEGSAPTPNSSNRPVNPASVKSESKQGAKPMSEREWRAHIQSLKS